VFVRNFTNKTNNRIILLCGYGFWIQILRKKLVVSTSASLPVMGMDREGSERMSASALPYRSYPTTGKHAKKSIYCPFKLN
jgi:hypothetical protein